MVATRRVRALEAFLTDSIKADVAILAPVALAALIPRYAAFDACSVPVDVRISRGPFEVAI